MSEELIVTKEHDFYYSPPDHICGMYMQKAKLPIENLDFVKELSRFFYYQMIDDPDYLKDEFIDQKQWPANIDPSEISDKIQFYEEIFDEWMPGYSPLQKAINTLKLLAKAEKNKPKGKKQTLMESLPKLRQLKPDKEQFECQTWDKLLNKRNLDEFEPKLEHLNRIAIIKGFGKTFDIKKTSEDKKVFHSRTHKQKRMTEYSEITKSLIYQRMFPNYRQKLVTKDLPIISPIKTEESKQKIIMLVDFSGSMCCEFKQNWVLDIVADRLYYAMKEECEIFFSFFISDLHGPFYHIHNEATASEFFKKFNIHPSGGDTQIGSVIDKIKKEVDKANGKFFNLDVDLSKEKPEILVINDGQDTCKVREFNWKTNAITLDSRNDELKKLCEDSGGRYITIDSSGKIGS